MKISNKQILIEQIALLFASLVWTGVVLTGLALFWAYQDVQARWQLVLNAPPEALAQAASPTATPSPTATLWPGPGPTLTPSPTQPPTPTATWVVPPPNILPETLNPDEPTPVPVIIPTQAEVAVVEPAEPTPTLVPPTDTPVPPTAPPASIPELLPAEPQAPPTATATLVVIATPTATPTSPPAALPTLPPANPPAEAGVPTHLVIESVGIDSSIIPVGWQVIEQNGQQYSIWQVADYAVGWHQTSAKLGQVGNTVMAGHHNVNGEVFRDLVNVEVGDKVIVYSGEQKLEYVVELKTIVKEKGEPLEARQRNAEWIASTTDERLTFVTCWPYTNNTHRVIVVAKPI